MLRVQVEKWAQSAEQLRQLALSAEHPRSRERLMALYEICGGKNVEHFQARLNDDPLALSQRLWVATQLDPEIEKLRFST
jgi:hypothetical protein